LGAGAALGAAVGAAGVTALAGGVAVGAARMAGGAALGAIRAGTSMGSAASTAYRLGQETSASPTMRAGIGGVSQAAGNALKTKMQGALGVSEAAATGRASAWAALNNTASSQVSSATGESQPTWARALKRQQDMRHHRQVAVQALRDGDRGGASATPDIKEKEY
jgi:type IV secretion system protein TrbL